MPVLGAQQAPRRTVAEADFVKEPGGTVLARVARDATLLPGTARGTWQEATIEGWVAANALRDDNREGFDVAVSLSAGAPVRTGPAAGAVIATARAGALFKRLETRSGWVRVRRTGWLTAAALPAASSTPPAAGQQAVPAAGAPTKPTSINAGATISASPRAAPVATVETPLRVDIIERREGWTRVRIDGWVRDDALSDAPAANQISGADVRDNPERHVGQPVDWTLQILAVQQADELRPELPPGQPYVLARGPLPETGFVYLVVRVDEVAMFRNLEPLAKVRVRATIRSGRTRFLPTPVLNFVRRLD